MTRYHSNQHITWWAWVSAISLSREREREREQTFRQLNFFPAPMYSPHMAHLTDIGNMNRILYCISFGRLVRGTSEGCVCICIVSTGQNGCEWRDKTSKSAVFVCVCVIGIIVSEAKHVGKVVNELGMKDRQREREREATKRGKYLLMTYTSMTIVWLEREKR